MLLVILLILALLALGGGVYAGPRYGPWWGFSPLGIVLICILVLLLTGNL